MPTRKYVTECWNRYQSGDSPEEYVRCVLETAEVRARGENLVRKATQALVELSRKKSPDEFVTLREICEHAGIRKVTSTGLWDWYQKPADVIEKKTRARAYKIKPEFYEAFQRLFPHSIMELQGLGKEVWAGIDAQEYVNHERASWAG